MSFEILDYFEATKDTGGRIMVPGAYANVPMSIYHAQPCGVEGIDFSVSSSGLRTIFLQSLKHFWDQYVNPLREDRKQTEPMILGRAGHHLLLGEADYRKFFTVQPAKYLSKGEEKDWNNNATVCKEWHGKQALAGLTVLTAKQVEAIKGIAKSLAAEGPIQGGILNGHIEVSLFWIDPETGIWLKWRPDAIPNYSGDFADLKIVADVSDDGIARGIAERGYHQQGALGAEGSRQVLKMEMEHFTLVYAESTRPHCCRFEDVAPEELKSGAMENRAALRLLGRALKTNHWPGPQSEGGEGGYVRRPKYAADRAGRRLAAINADLAA